MAKDRNYQIRRAHTEDEVWNFIRARIRQQQELHKKRTLPFEVSIDDDGRITNYTFQPAKELPPDAGERTD